ncbi:hypothetical protein PP651_gp17 [Aeromonas phage ZPAH14]|uniref:DNA-directed RNA polymerase n=1 Tax=Aeromonas phage ZPAH14 TaxID=2924887 RepID=A0AAE9GZT2_9CAUD|nr:hypothetical protein PP651_gp01 [Aeromonas phage ZPAH14]YP_010656771.1 hypothetical protein PP651_gp17 [Aeromonas phage ZPAH14]UOT57993.1 hypothetical protein [Aeromonas phage ZPAH14]UOT58062.1 hypothetical protein [Aeromonas phage ZPAH14]
MSNVIAARFVNTFCADTQQMLEDMLIAMLDSGTLSEEVAMALNTCTDMRQLRACSIEHNVTEEMVHVIQVLTGKFEDVPMVDGTNVDLSEFFVCNTPEEAKALRSWADVFGVTIPTTMSVVEEKPMTAKKELTAAEKASREFAAIVKNKELTHTSQNIVLDDIERKSAGFIATALVHALEKDGFYVQQFNEDIDPRNYFFSCNANFDNRRVAMLSVQLAGVLPFLDAEYDFDHVVATAVFRRRFRDIARANQFIPGVYNQMMDAAGTTHWHERLQAGLKLAIKAGLIDERYDEEAGVTYIKHSMKYIGSCISRTSIMHQQEKITKDSRRKERVKTRSNARKDGTSAEVREALEYIESQAQCVNRRLLEALEGVEAFCLENEFDLPAVMQESKHVLFGAKQMRDVAELFSEYFMDLRGRMYQFAHCGPNPQASDMAKALCYHTVREEFFKDTPQYTMFMNEMFGEVCPTDSVWAQERYIRRTAADPKAALIHAFQTNNGALPFKKFFSYMDMCVTWVDLQDTGRGITQLGFGPDAKCSGAQIFSILAGCPKIAEACGLVTGFGDNKPKDPYYLSAHEVNIVAASVKAALQPSRTITRNEIKTPFMAIQYGGGVPSLRYKKFEPTMEALGIAQGDRDAFCKEVVIKGINNALGAKIGGFIEGLRKAVEAYCEEHDVDYFEYRHIDGFKVTKKGEADVVMTNEPFIINYGEAGQGVIFGSKESNTGWKVTSRTSGILQRRNFCYYFPVHFVQGIDAVMARKIALGAKKAGLRGYSTIHDQFRSCINDAPRLRSEVVPQVYVDMFIDNNPVTHLEEQMGRRIEWGNPLEARTQVLTKEILFSADAYYFE